VHRRSLFLAAALASGAPLRAQSPTASEDVTALADRYVARSMEQFPEGAELSGITAAPHDHFTDNSLAALASWEGFEDSIRAELGRVDAASLAGTPAWVIYGYLREVLDASTGARVCRQELWPVNQAFGWQTTLAQVATLQPVGTPEARATALARWRTIGRFVDTELANLREGARLGYTATASTARVVAGQLDALLAAPVDSLPFMDPARRDSTPEFREAWRALVTESLLPAARRYRDYLRADYLRQARTAPAVAANRDGAACYRALLRQATTVDRDPRTLFREISRKVTRDSTAMIRIAAHIYPPPRRGPRDARWLRERIEADSSNLIPTAAAVLAFSDSAVRRARAAVPRWFIDAPDVDVILRPFPDYQQPTAPGGQYLPPAEDGSRPAVYLYRTYPPVRRIGLKSTIYHETWPGHHLQGIIASRRREAHPIIRLVWFAGFGEGWATYSERLAEEMGLYQTARDSLGFHAGGLAPLMVADLGMQVMGWTPERAVEYVTSHAPNLLRERAAVAVDLIAALPGYVASYTVGALEIERLRDSARKALGPRFDVREFHRIALEDGAVPLPLFRDKLTRWIAERRRT